MLKSLLSVLALGVAVGAGFAADGPIAEISNGLVRAKVHLPDGRTGFYRGTRFDWAGVVSDLEYSGHNYYPRWFDRVDATIRDFVYEGASIAASPCTAVTGPAEEFRTPLGYDEAKPGGTFVKIGVGVLRKKDAAAYDSFHLYEVVDGGRWSVRKTGSAVEFVQELSDAGSGYGYLYKKTVALTKGQSQMVLSHSLKNTGKVAIRSTVYNHNFLYLDRRPPGPDFVIRFPFEIRGAEVPPMAEVRGKQVGYTKILSGEDRVQMAVSGFGAEAKDYDIRIENKAAGAGVRITGDRPLSRIFLWSIRAPLSVEPFVNVEIQPGGEFSWKIVYDYYTLPTDRR
ncbi:hypothetical protein [Paludibaculum fermentans]|uniref:hypothetical protein n=1 Tax=Paludibaculum fermentans TaxID=1473598 RepID=UPI003EBA0CC0